MLLRGFVIFVAGVLAPSGLIASLLAQAPRVAIVVHNRARVPGGVVQDAQEIVNRMYEAAGIGLDWFHISPTLETARFNGQKVHVLIMRKNESAHFRHTQDAVGFTPASGSSYGPLAYILEHRVRAVSRGYSVLPSVVLGAVMAHELGHMLLSSGHARDGVMRAKFNQADLRRVARGQLGFTPAQAADLRARLTRHSEERTAAARIAR
jgi:hypothetical protein